MATRSGLVLILLAVPLEACYLIVRRLGDLGSSAVEYVGVSLVIAPLYLISCWWVIRRGEGAGSLGVILAAGLAFRLTLLGTAPTLTEDPYRHRWEGKLQGAGGNPYVARPEEERWRRLRDRSWPLVNRKELPTVYGPLIEWMHRGTYAAVSRLTPDEFLQARLFQLPYLVFDLATVWALAGLLRQLGLPASRLLIYVWSPLAVVEFWSSGHNDSVVVFFVTAAVWAACAGRWGWGFGALWMATLAKFWPALLFPLFARHAGRNAARALAWAPLAVLISFPYRDGVQELSGMLAGFLGGWHNNASLFQGIYLAAGENYEQAKPWVALLVAAAAMGVAWRRPALPQGSLVLVVALLFLSANCFPWYLLWFVPLLAVIPNAALLLWTALVPLAYHSLIGYTRGGRWEYNPLFLWLEYAPVFGMLVGGWLAQRVKR